MINFDLLGVFHLMKGLADLEQNLKSRADMREAGLTLKGAITISTNTDPKAAAMLTEIMKIVEGQKELSPEIGPADISRAEEWLNYSVFHANQMELSGALERIEIFRKKLKSKISVPELHAEVRTLRETFDSGLKAKSLYQYPQHKVLRLLHFRTEWSPALSAFPSIENDVEAAVDCYAFGRNTASVFHAMRIVEYGLREFAAALNIDFDVQQWHNVIDQIDSEIREIGNRWPASARKSSWLRFYSEAAKEFFYFKDGWRNYVSHGGDPYDDYQALSALEHVRAFMNHLAHRFGP